MTTIAESYANTKQKIRILDYYQPLGPKSNVECPVAPIAEAITYEYTKEIVGDLLKPWFNEESMKNITCMSSFLFPRAKVRNLVAAQKYTNLLFIHDDLFDRMTMAALPPDHPEYHPLELLRDPKKYKEIKGVYAQIFFSGSIPKNAKYPNSTVLLYKQQLELSKEFLELTDQDWMKRFAVDVKGFSAAQTKDHSTVLDIEEYCDHRERDSGMYPTIDLVEVTEGYTLTNEEISRPEIQRMRKSVARIASLLNDVISFEKELKEGSDYSLVTTFFKKNGGDFTSAVKSALEFINKERDIYFEQQDILLKKYPDSDKLKRYCEALVLIIDASWYWQLHTSRYKSPNSIFEELILYPEGKEPSSVVAKNQSTKYKVVNFLLYIWNMVSSRIFNPLLYFYK